MFRKQGQHAPCKVKDLTPTAKYKFIVPGIVPNVAQPTAQTCWATVTTMMVSWYDNTSYTIAQVMDQAGPVYRAKFDNNHGLSSSEKTDFLAALGLYEEPARRYTAAGLCLLMHGYGPLWVTMVEAPSEDFAVRARVLTGMCGDGSLEHSFVWVNDPADGKTYTDSLSGIAQKLGSIAGPEGELWIQVVHF